MESTKTWTPERKKTYQAEYHRNRWKSDPEFRKRHQTVARESAKRRRKEKRLQRWAVFPFGYVPPPGLVGHDLHVHFLDFLTDNAGCPPLAHAYWLNPFDPRCDDAQERWQKAVDHVTKECPGLDPLEHLHERADTFIRENRHTASS